MKRLWLPKCSPEAGNRLRFYYVVTEVVPIYSSSIEERVSKLLSVAGLGLKALVVVPHIILNWVLCQKVTASCGSNLSARFLWFKEFCTRYGRH